MKPELMSAIRRMHNEEATDAQVYSALAGITKSENNRSILKKMASDEAKHRDIWAGYVDGPAKINRFKVRLYILLGRIFGLVFVLNLMESGEDQAIKTYRDIGQDLPVALEVLQDEQEHEGNLISMLKEEKLSYVSSMVLGLNDALVELTGALAGFTLALNNNSMIGLAGFITGVAATLSMATSEYLSKKADNSEKHPLKAATYTGLAYLFTVTLLLLPYAVFSSPLVALAFCLGNATLIILGFTFFVSVVRKQSFLRGFREMLLISFSVALLSFLIGWAARSWLNLDI